MSNIAIKKNLYDIKMHYQGIYRDDYVNRANQFIRSFLYSSAIEYNIILTGLIKSRNNFDEFGRPCCTVYSNELRDVNLRSDGAFYKALEKAVSNLSKMRILVKSDKTGHLMYISVFNTCEKIEGNIRMTFSPEISQFLECDHGNYSSVRVGYVFSLKGIYAKRLYEVLYSYMYKIRNQKSIEVRFELSELEMLLGCIDIEDSGIKNKVEMKCSNATELLTKSTKKPMVWQTFKTRVLEPSLEQIASMTDINASYDVARNGRGGKVTHVIFNLTYNDVVDQENYNIQFISSGKETVEENIIEVESKISDISDEGDLIVEVLKYLENEDISYKKAKDLLKAANNDISKIKSAYEFSKSKNGIKDLVGWLVSAIKEDWSSSAPTTPFMENPLGDMTNDERAILIYDKYKESDEFKRYLSYLKMDIVEFELYLTSNPESTILPFLDWKRQNN